MKCLWQLPEQVRIREKKNSARLKRKILRLKLYWVFACCVLALKLSEYCINIQVHFISKDAHLYKSTIGNEKFCAVFETEESLKWPNSGQQLICKKVLAIKKKKKIIIKQCLFTTTSLGYKFSVEANKTWILILNATY